MGEAVSPAQRFTRWRPCPVCDGWDAMPRGRGERCAGFLSSDGRYAHCTREEYAGDLAPEDTGADLSSYAHRLDGPCRCGRAHAAGEAPLAPRTSDGPVRSPTRAHRRVAPIATHEYQEADGRVRFRVARFWSKTPPPDRAGLPKVLPQTFDGEDWRDGMGGLPYGVLYHLPALRETRPESPVYVVEGEACADALLARGVTATCNAGGAGKWESAYTEQLRGRHVVVLADADAPGRAHAARVAGALRAAAASVRVVELPGLAEHGDVVDWLEAGHTVDDLDGSAHATEGAALIGPRIPGVIVADVERRAIRWLWTGRMAAGKLMLVDGDPGLGKGLLGIDLAARLTTGRPLPGDAEAAPPCGVILVTPEDDVADTIRPRLEAAGADLRRVRVLTSVVGVDPETGEEAERVFTVPRDLAALEAAIVHDGAGLVIIDPIMACLDAGTKTGVDNEVRAALMPLKALAERTGASVLLIRHLNKGGGEKAIYRGGGSIAFTGTCRTAFLLAEHPDGGDRRVLAPVKSNVGRLAAALWFAIVDHGGGDVALEWDDAPCAYDANALLSSRVSDQRREVLRILQDAAPDAMGPQEMAAALGYTPGQDYNTVRQRLSRMARAGQLTVDDQGRYSLPAADVSQCHSVTDAGLPPKPAESGSPELEQRSVGDGVTPIPPAPPEDVCRYERHADGGWQFDGGRWVCRICHPAWQDPPRRRRDDSSPEDGPGGVDWERGW